MRPLVLVTGATGQLGGELVRALAPHARVAAPARAELDLADLGAVRAYVADLKPAAIVNAAAYTAVDKAESDQVTCRLVNAEAPGVLAAVAAEIDAVMVHYSTDYVFDGTSPRPYVETDATNPLNVYGESKRDGELAVAAAGGTHLILRTSWVYGATGANFLRTMLRLAREREEIRVVDDQVGAPTWSRAIAEATATILRGSLSSPAERDALRSASGIYHLTAAGETSWYGFAKAIVEAMPEIAGRPRALVVPIPSSEYPTAARRPARSVLDSGKIAMQFGIVMPDWRERVALVMQELV